VGCTIVSLRTNLISPRTPTLWGEVPPFISSLDVQVLPLRLSGARHRRSGEPASGSPPRPARGNGFIARDLTQGRPIFGWFDSGVLYSGFGPFARDLLGSPGDSFPAPSGRKDRRSGRNSRSVYRNSGILYFCRDPYDFLRKRSAQSNEFPRMRSQSLSNFGFFLVLAHYCRVGRGEKWGEFCISPRAP
jgi:hypothetical protein